MPRPSLKEARTEEIIDAFERCIIRDGLPSCSLENIAQEAAMKRSILRHYIGNRDDIILALGNRWRQRFQEEWLSLSGLSQDNPIPKIIDALFVSSENTKNDTTHIIITDALFAETRRLPDLAKIMTAMMDDFVNYFSHELKIAFPKATKTQCLTTAHGVQAQYLLLESMIPLQFDSKKEYFRHLKRAALQQVEHLKYLSLLKN